MRIGYNLFLWHIWGRIKNGSLRRRILSPVFFTSLGQILFMLFCSYHTAPIQSPRSSCSKRKSGLPSVGLGSIGTGERPLQLWQNLSFWGGGEPSLSGYTCRKGGSRAQLGLFVKHNRYVLFSRGAVGGKQRVVLVIVTWASCNGPCQIKGNAMASN